MTSTLVSMDDLEARFVAWAKARPDVRAAIVVGSRARTDHPADEWADLDVGFITTDQKRYLKSAKWLSEIAPVWLWYPDSEGITRHVLFAGGFDAGLAPIPAASIKLGLRAIPVLRRYPAAFRLLPNGPRLHRDLESAGDYYRRGVRVILDKDGLAARFLAMFPAKSLRHEPPAAAQFRRTVAEFWFLAVWTAKHLRRGELYWAKTNGCDGRMKAILLRMIEWHARATHGPDYDTWEHGRFLEEWAGERTLHWLGDTFARYNAHEVADALVATMDVFRSLATETAGMLGYAYPDGADSRVTEWVTGCLAQTSD